MNLPENWPAAAVSIAAAAGLSFIARAIDAKGAVAGILIAVALFLGGGFPALGLLLLFFVLGSGASRLGYARKKAAGAAQESGGRRSAVNALANGGAAAISGAAAWILPDYASVLQVISAGALAAATSDTLSSEIGSLYGNRYRNIVSWRTEPRGIDGAVSIAGSIAGIAGAGAIALAFWAGGGRGGWVVFAAGMAGNYADSLLGATLQRRGLLNNHGVNAAATAFAGIIAGIAALLAYNTEMK